MGLPVAVLVIISQALAANANGSNITHGKLRSFAFDLNLNLIRTSTSTFNLE